jgi:hypothetical protein
MIPDHSWQSLINNGDGDGGDDDDDYEYPHVITLY